jgi:hypothetical protein
MRLLILALFTCILTACATGQSSNYTPSAKSWRGARTTDLLAAWGQPFSTVKLANGSTIYTYKQQTKATTTYSPSIGITNSPTHATVVTDMPNVNAPAGNDLTAYCFATVNADKHGVITKIDIQGTHCNFK